jgi:hypothetical protein
MNFKNTILLLFLLFMNCKSIELKDVKKQLVLPGYITEKAKFKYSSKIISKRDFKILSVKIDKIKTSFNNFIIIQLPKGTIKKAANILKLGEYYIELNIPINEIEKESIEVITIEILLGNKRLEIEGKTLLINDLLSR